MPVKVGVVVRREPDKRRRHGENALVITLNSCCERTSDQGLRKYSEICIKS